MVRGVKKTSKPANEPVRANNTRQGLAFAVGDAPCLADPKAAQDRLAEWLSEAGDGAAGKSLKQLIGEAPRLEALLLGLADGSPYLWDLATAEPDRLLTVLTAEPGGYLAALLAKSAEAVATAEDEATAMQLLRRMKAEAALMIAVADIGGVWPVMRTTQALTEVADTAARAAVRYLLREAAANGKLKPADAAAPEADSCFIVRAMGKLGAY